MTDKKELFRPGDNPGTLLDELNEGYYEVDLAGRLIEVNETVARLTGIPRQRMLGISNRDYMEPASAAAIYDVFNRVYQTGTSSRIPRLLVQIKEGPAFWTEFTVSLLRAQDGTPVGFRGLVRDIRDIVLAETSLVQANARFLGLFQAIPDIVYFKDAERRNILINKAFETTFGLSQAEIEGRLDEDFLPPRLAEECRKSDEVVLTSGGLVRFEEETVLGDGRKEYFETIKAPILNPDGCVIGLIGVSRDITERKLIEKALQASEERYRRLVENSLDGIYQTDLEGRLLSANSAMKRMLGYPVSEEAAGYEVVSSYVDVRQRDRLLETMERDGEVRNMEIRLRRRDGTEFHVLTNAKAAKDADGRMIIEGILTDITAQKDNQQALAAALAEKNVLLQEVHHRVKNNLQVISSLLNLQSRYLSHPADAELFRESQRRIRSMALIHERLYQSKSLSRIEFGAYTQRLAENLIATHPHGGTPVRLKTDLKEVSLDIQTAIPCGLIVNELVMNSLKHAFPDGRPGEIRLGLQVDEEGRVELKIGDNGIGLPTDFSFATSDSMGMQIVEMLAGQLEGRLDIGRENGTEFRLTFKELKYKPRL
ncbi:MAG: PAS domain S-box protein [Acidobacteriota bacterium]|nr:PAS domain S-box protein [Acidobacteriota bacterium]